MKILIIREFHISLIDIFLKTPYHIYHYYLPKHVAGIVALMAEKNSGLTATQAETILEGVGIPIPDFGPADYGSGLVTADDALANTP